MLVVGAGEVFADDVLLSAKFTDLGEQIDVPGSANGTTYGTDPSGREIGYTVVTGAHGVDARLVGVDLVTAAITLNLPVPNAMGAWAATTADDGTIYITGYNYADLTIGGRLYSYRPGDTVVNDLGAPVAGDGFLYGATPGPDGSVLGGTYPSGVLFRYQPGTGFTKLGDTPVSPGIQYVRSVAYDSSTGLVYAGTATTSHIVACPVDGSGGCAEVLPASYARLPWVYDLSAGDGHAFARVTDDHGEDHLVVIKASRAADGSIQSSVVNDLPGIAYPGTSNVIGGSTYYAKAGELYRYDTATESETDLGVNTGIYARTWSLVQLADQATYPGYTLVGINAGGIVARYNLQTGNLGESTVPQLPKAVVDVESIQGGPDGKVYSAGYLVGGLGVYAPMRSDQDLQLSGGAWLRPGGGHDRTRWARLPGRLPRRAPRVVRAVGRGRRPRTAHRLRDRQRAGSSVRHDRRAREDLCGHDGRLRPARRRPDRVRPGDGHLRRASRHRAQPEHRQPGRVARQDLRGLADLGRPRRSDHRDRGETVRLRRGHRAVADGRPSRARAALDHVPGRNPGREAVDDGAELPARIRPLDVGVGLQPEHLPRHPVSDRRHGRRADHGLRQRVADRP